MLAAEPLKIILLFTLLAVTFFFSMLPLIVHIASSRRHMSVHRRQCCRSVVSLLSCFAAGVFIGICFLDLFPEVENNINQVMKAAEIDDKFPIPEFVIVIGFLLLLAVEQFVLTWKARAARGPNGDQLGPLLADCDSITNSYSSVTPATFHAGAGESASGFDSLASDPFMSSHHSHNHDDGIVVRTDASTENSDGVNQAYTDPSSHSVIRSLILLVALSLHSLFEGLAVGLQSTVDDTLRLFVALALHKCIIAFSIGLNMVQSKLTSRAIVVSNTIFSLASPFGIGIGVAIVNIWRDSVTASAVIGVLQGLACGTFIYVVFFEILPHEFMKQGRVMRPDRLIKVFSLLIGFSVVVGVLFLDPQA